MNLTDYPKTNKKLGALYTRTETTFHVWAPTQTKISVAIYESAKSLSRTLYSMTKANDGVFSAVVAGDLHNRFYTYIVDGDTEVTDPYCISTAANSVRSAIVDLERTHPEDWLNHTIPKGNNGCDAILYEVHVADFSAHSSSGMTHKGKFLAFSENDTKIGNHSTGLDHIIDLGVTHVHMMPVYDYLTVDEEVENDANYNWGYDPEHYNALEGSYATKPNDPSNRIYEFKKAVMALHEKGIKVVLDVVYNHTYRTEHSNFNVLVPKYYHRTTEEGYFSNGSGCGNEFASETPMGRKFIIDSLLYWATEFRIDGFRFDLMALIDKDTIDLALKELRKINPEMLFYGEPWMGGASTLDEKSRVYKGAQCLKGYALFNDDFRDAIKGDNDGTGKGFIHGNKDMKHKLHTGLLGSIAYDAKYIGFTAQPCESINYFNSHDNLILQDKLLKTTPGATDDELLKQTKLSFDLLFMAQGVPFFHAGNEFMRDKKGHHNTYNAPLSINAIDWNNKTKHYALYQYVKDLIRLRKSYPSFRIKSATDIKERVHFIEDNDFIEAFKDGIVYVIKQNEDPTYSCLLVAHNPSKEAMLLDVNRLKEEILELYEHADLPMNALKIELVFDEVGLHEPNVNIDPMVQHLVKVKAQSSAVFKLGRKDKAQG